MLVNLSGGWSTSLVPAKNITPGNILNKTISSVPTISSTPITGTLLRRPTTLLNKPLPSGVTFATIGRTLSPEVTKAAQDVNQQQNNPTILTPSSPLSIPPPYSGGGGGGSSTDSASTDTPVPAAGIEGLWTNLSTAGKLGVVGGGLVILYFGYKMLHKNGGRTAAAPKSEIKS